MTSRSLRIYTYKITFEEVSYYYYGVKKEKYFNEEYWGSPKTHKWCWELYTPKKQILEVFDYTDEGWLEAQEVEKRLIQPVFNTDKWCLNENCGGKISLKVSREVGLKSKENGLGIHGLTLDEKIEIGKTNYKKGIGIASISTEERIEIGRKSGKKTYELGIAVFGVTPEERKKINEKNFEMKVGIYSITPEERSQNAKNNYENGIGLASITKEERKEIVAKTNSQKWMCLETGYITTAGPLTNYQRVRGIDTSKRKRIN